MLYFKFAQLQKIFAVVLLVFVPQTSLFAQTPANNLPIQQEAAFPAVPLPPDNGAPTQREGAASRGPCINVSKKNLTALVPLVKLVSSSQSATSGVVLGKTAAPRPSFWFYVPYTLTSEHPVEFMLQDEAGKEIYSTSLKASETNPGVVGFQLPASAPALAVGKRYRWFFSIYCSEDSPVIVAGLVERISLNSALENQLEQATPSEKVALYQKADLWHEALTTLAQLRRQNPQEEKLQTAWSDLLQSIGLKAIAPEPLTALLTQTSRTTETHP